jgi:hypothetical protein
MTRQQAKRTVGFERSSGCDLGKYLSVVTDSALHAELPLSSTSVEGFAAISLERRDSERLRLAVDWKFVMRWFKMEQTNYAKPSEEAGQESYHDHASKFAASIRVFPGLWREPIDPQGNIL